MNETLTMKKVECSNEVDVVGAEGFEPPTLSV